MKIFICILALASVANATLSSLLHGGGSNNGGHNGGHHHGGHHAPLPPPIPVVRHAPHVVNIYHHAAPAVAPVSYGAVGHHEQVIKVIHESSGLSHGGLAVGGLSHGGLSHGVSDVQLVNVVNEAPVLHHAPVVHSPVVHAPVVHHQEHVKVIKVINEQAPLVQHVPLVHHAPAAHVQVLKVLHQQAVHPQSAGW